jgi:hypothetical protein
LAGDGARHEGARPEGQQQTRSSRKSCPDGVINLSDPDARVMRTQGTPPRQAYSAQTAFNDRQIILATEITVDAPDFGHLEPMLDTTLRHLNRHGAHRKAPGAAR